MLNPSFRMDLEYPLGLGCEAWDTSLESTQIQSHNPIIGERGAEVYALKDTWIATIRKPEREWYKVLHEAAKGDLARLKKTEEHFLKLHSHGIVQIGGQSQNTSYRRRNKCLELADTLSIKKVMDMDPVRILSRVCIRNSSLPVGVSFCSEFRERVQYLLVLVGIGIPLDRFSNWSGLWKELAVILKSEEEEEEEKRQITSEHRTGTVSFMSSKTLLRTSLSSMFMLTNWSHGRISLFMDTQTALLKDTLYRVQQLPVGGKVIT